MSVQLPQESGPLWTALVEILNAERAEKDRLKQDIELLSTDHANERRQFLLRRRVEVVRDPVLEVDLHNVGLL